MKCAGAGLEIMHVTFWNTMHVLKSGINLNSKVIDKLTWQRNLQDSTAFQLWCDGCWLVLFRFIVRIGNKRQSMKIRKLFVQKTKEEQI